MKAFLTGATGFIGSHLAEALVAKGYAITCLVRRSSDLRWIRHLDAEIVYGDAAEGLSFPPGLGDYRYIFHLAGLTKAVREKDFFLVNNTGTANLLKAAAAGDSPLRRFVHLSSLAATGPSRDGRPVDETTPPAPVSAYGRSKLMAEETLRTYENRLPFTIIRPPAVFGPRDRDFLVLFKAINKGLLPYWGRNRYSMLYVGDLVEGIIAAAENPAAEGRTYFLSDRNVYTSDDIAGEIAGAVGRKPLRLRVPRAIFPLLGFLGQKFDKKGIINRDRIVDFSYPDWICDSARAEKELGYSARTMLREGITWTAAWYRTHQWL